MPSIIALIRGINVGSTRKLPMAALRTACREEGLGEVRTYIQSGNLVVEHDSASALETRLETLISTRFGLDVPVIARTNAQWQAYVDGCPFSEEAERAPRALHLLICKRPPLENTIDELRGRAKHDEKIAAWGSEIAIHFTNGAADTKLSPSLIDRLIGSPATARNWNTVRQLMEMARS